ncbi:MAG: LPS export ABC transporter periplasmic protein LptC [Amphiplicatus sp.]
MTMTATTGTGDSAPRGRLDTLPTRQRITGSQAAARSLAIRRLRIALPVVGLALIAALALNTRHDAGENAFLDDFANLEATPEQLRMANPRFAGVDDKGFPYEVTADAALQAPSAPETVELIKPKAMTRGGSESTVVSANSGTFQSKEKLLTLKDAVTLKHDIGGEIYTLRTDSAVISISEEAVRSTGPVEGEGAAGALRADSMRAFNNEGRVLFEGNVSMRLYPEKAKAGATESKKQEGSDQ